MAGNAHAAEPAHLVGAHEPAHPTATTYVKIAAILAVVTLGEVAVYYIEAFAALLVPIFLVLSATKFALVALFYMHLKFDSRLFSGFFVGGLFVAASIIIALMALFAGHPTISALIRH